MSVLTPGRNLVLIGLMGSGKSTVGKVLAERLGRSFVDTDDIVEAEAGATISEIFSDQGERAFRDLEAMAVRQVTALRGQVIAVGGGAVLNPANVTQLRMTGDLVLLDAPAATLAERVGGEGTQTRPLVADAGHDLEARLARLAAERRHVYETSAASIVATEGRSPQEIAEEILSWAATRPGLLARDERDLL